jgi:hypothetical protein
MEKSRAIEVEGGGVGRVGVGVPAEWPERRELVEEIAELVAERVVGELGGRQVATRAELIDAHDVARILGCKRTWVYEHKSELPLVRLGGGSRPRLRFDRARVEAMAASEVAQPDGETEGPTRSPNPRRRRRGPSVPLLEIKGRSP